MLRKTHLSIILLSFFLIGSLAAFAQTRMIPHITNPSGIFSTKIILVNGSVDDGSYTLQAYDGSGNTVMTASGGVPAGLTQTHSVADLFGTDAVSHFTISNDTGVTAFVSYQAIGGSPAQVQETDTQAKRWQLFAGDWNVVTDGFAVVNMGSSATNVTVTQRRPDGSIAQQLTAISGLAPNTKGLYILDGANFTSGENDVFQISAAEPVALLALRFNKPSSIFFWQNSAVAISDEDPVVVGGKRNISILYTNDEHGWMEPTDTHAGAAGLLGLWREQEGYTEDGPFLILSGGDTMTGPAVSTWTKGESMIDVMNTIGYDASALGNHEFDFGLDGLNDRAEQADFPFLAANVREKATGAIPSFIQPYTIKEVNGVKVGIIGLATTSTPFVTFPTYVEHLDFLPYLDALTETVPQVRAAGAELIMVIGHTCARNLAPLADDAAGLGISILAGGHCHERHSQIINGVPVIETGSAMRFYSRIDLEFDKDTGTVTDVQIKDGENTLNAATPDSTVEARVTYWQSQTDGVLQQEIGYLANEITNKSVTMANMITDAWLAAVPEADIAMVNNGGMRQTIPAGPITRGTIVGVLPFENYIMQVELTGAQVIQAVECCTARIGGMSTLGGYTLADGTPIQNDQTYIVLASDFNYYGGDGWTIQEFDPTPFATNLQWRDPVIEWIESLETSQDKPLDTYLDGTPRQKQTKTGDGHLHEH